MKKLLCITVMLTILSFAFSMDISVLGTFGNANMSWTSTTPIAEPAFPYTNWLPGMEITLSENTANNISFSIDYLLDPVLRSLLTGTINYNLGIFKLGIGPMAGLFNTWSVPVKAGITTLFGIDIIGSFFAGISVGSSIGAPPSAPGDYMQEYNTLYAGYYLSNAVCTLAVDTKSLYVMGEANTRIIDRSTEYKFITELFKKNVPYTLTLGFSAIKISRDYGNSVIDSLFNLMVKTKFSYSVVPGVYIDMVFNGVVYSLGLDALAGRGPANNTLLFSAGFGVTFRPDLYRTSAALPSEPTTEPTTEPETNVQSESTNEPAAETQSESEEASAP
ncbi:MAG TPA: hypothetical protein P5519_02245 [Spirochaetia bacterium]|nr:hypothetical protein [Spirochaetales bacterium]HOT58777.1 hypothetical protein [Spirochaetales bacterium]HPD80523.1 hypothetical protein [Spirochaetales bacterium]HQK34721.1 hypothetical protein [Spirochaetales bacterium]HRS64696.1 hypothetical protein [Spirochaetia bacterium]